MPTEVIDNFINAGTSTFLSSPIDNATTNLPVFIPASPTLQQGQFHAMLIDPNTGNREIVIVTANQQTATWTVLRGQDNTTPQNFPAGSIVRHVITAGALQNVISQTVQAAVNVTAGGALAADHGRSGTNAAPVLRDFVAIKDYGAKGGARNFTSGATVTANVLSDINHHPFSQASVGMTVNLPGMGTSGRNFSTTIQNYTDTGDVTLAAAPPNPGGGTGAYQISWDDTVTIQTGLNNIGQGVLFFGPDKYMVKSLVPKDGVMIWGYGAVIWQIAGQSNAVFYDNTTDNVTVHKGFVCLGLEFHGTGLVVATNGQLDAIWLVQWMNVIIRDCNIDGFADGAINVGGSLNVWIVNNNVSNCTIAGQRNAIRLGQGSTNTSLSVGNWFVLDNDTSGTIATAALSINNQAGTQRVVGRIIVTDNNFQTTGSFASVFFEVNTTGGGVNESTEGKILFADNFVINTGTSSTSDCMVWIDDGSNPYNDPAKFRYITIATNYFESSANSTAGSTDAALVLDISHASILGNTIIENGTRGMCMYIAQSPLATGTIGNLYSDNKLYSLNAAATNHVVRIRAATNWKFSGGFIFCSSTVTGSAISIENTCVSWTVTKVAIYTPAENGISCAAGMNDGKIIHNDIYNPNASNNTSNSTSHGVYVTGTHGGTLNLIEHNNIWDDRATAQMKNGIFRGGTGTMPLVGPNHVQGTTNGAYSWQPLSPSIHGLQAPMRRSAISTTLGTHEKGVIMTAAGTTLTLPTGYTAMQAALDYVAKAAAANITVSNGTAKIDAFTGGVNASTETMTTAGQVNHYMPDTNLSDVLKT